MQSSTRLDHQATVRLARRDINSMRTKIVPAPKTTPGRRIESVFTQAMTCWLPLASNRKEARQSFGLFVHQRWYSPQASAQTQPYFERPWRRSPPRVPKHRIEVPRLRYEK